MNANELRIGNVVSCLNLETDYCLIESVSLKEIIGVRRTVNGFYANTWTAIRTPEPVFLTQNWLVNKFGFKDNGGGYYQHLEYNFFLFHNEEDEYFDCYKQVPANDDTGDFKSLQHVHKLQNLFYELFDEELEIKE